MFFQLDNSLDFCVTGGESDEHSSLQRLEQWTVVKSFMIHTPNKHERTSFLFVHSLHLRERFWQGPMRRLWFDVDHVGDGGSVGQQGSGIQTFDGGNEQAFKHYQVSVLLMLQCLGKIMHNSFHCVQLEIFQFLKIVVRNVLRRITPKVNCNIGVLKRMCK